MCFDQRFRNSEFSFEERRIALRSLIELIKLSRGTVVAEVRLKVIAVLRSSMSVPDKEMLQLSCKAWNEFLLNIDEGKIPTILYQVITAMLPLLECCPTEI